jgi:thioredoxin reductase (NADPH)
MADRAFANEKISFVWNSEVIDVIGDEKVSAVRVRDNVTGEEREIAANGLFVAIGHDPRSELVKGQVDLDDQGYVLVKDRSTLTNVPGVFASGDLVDHIYRQAVTAAGTGCAAALDAERYLAELADADRTRDPVGATT